MLILDDYGPYDTSIEMPVVAGTVHAWADFVDHECDWCKGDRAAEFGECECITGWVYWWIDGGTDVTQRGDVEPTPADLVDWSWSVIDWPSVPDETWDKLLRRALTIGADADGLGPRGERTALLSRQVERLFG